MCGAYCAYFIECRGIPCNAVIVWMSCMLCGVVSVAVLLWMDMLSIGMTLNLAQKNVSYLT